VKVDDELRYPVEGRLVWWRGPSKLQGGRLVLDTDRAEQYILTAGTGPDEDLAFDLATIDSGSQAAQFVEKWGFLRTGPNSGRTSEDLSELIAEGQRARTILAMQADLLRVNEGHSLEHERQWSVVLEALDVEGGTEPLNLAAVTAALVNDALGSTPLALAVNPAFGQTGEAPFFAAIGATDLLGFAYFQIASLLMDSIPMRECAMCQRPFEVHHPKQMYCSERCGTRARQRRFAAKKEK
jgi:hypothetical protein